MNINLRNKVVVITGSSKGIGRHIAYCFAKEESQVVITYNNSKEEAYNLFDEINKFNKKCIIIKADVSKEEEVKNLYRTVMERYNNKVDVLINNSGIARDNLLPMMTLKQWKDVIDVNLTGIYLCSRFFSKAMIKNRYGKIINITSLRGITGSKGQTNYAASKAGIIGFTKSLAKELEEFEITVNSICPGCIPTDLNKKIDDNRQRDSKYLYDLLNFLLFFSSDLCKNVTSQVFNLNSGISYEN
ncbi:MAG: SDR family NAD(P)-dependent oxidoreductase [Bacteroidetes bacterium]|nr:SDR family NAD(P)-dependent oxidoreductase [Bacteroidota bacterium]